MNKLKTLGQERLKFAYYRVKKVGQDKEYKSLVKGFSTMIMNNGLGQALAFLKAKNKEHHQKLYEHINRWFRSNECKRKISNDDILQEIMSKSSEDYRYLTEETLALLNWFRKFVDALIKTKD